MSVIHKLAEKFNPDRYENAKFWGGAVLLVGLLAMTLSFTVGGGVALYLGIDELVGATWGCIATGALAATAGTAIAAPQMICRACHKLTHKTEKKDAEKTDDSAVDAPEKPNSLARRIKNIFGKKAARPQHDKAQTAPAAAIKPPEA